jgi:hypothetical protein
MNPLSNPLTTIVSQPNLMGQILSSPVANSMANAGWVGVFTGMGVATRVRQKRMVAMRSAAHRSSWSGESPQADTGSIGNMEG